MQVEKGLRYSKDHEWAKETNERVYVGITDFAQHSLGDIVYIEPIKKGMRIKAGDTLAVVESVKAASDIYSPVSGVIEEINEDLSMNPELLNSKPYESWVAALSEVKEEEMNCLMDDIEYETYISK